MTTQSHLLLSYYGDDFTGSTDVMEALTLNGVRTVLFLEPPDPALVREQFPAVQAIGVAGISRTWTPAQMDVQLGPIFMRLRELEAQIMHYKICSTFDSSPDIGSIGRAIEIGQQQFAARVVPLLVGAPVLRRYTVFGNQFATVGNETFRLDRHPTMRFHPVTPMHESDLRVHLGQQTAKSIGLFDLLHLSGTEEELDQRFAALLATQPEIVLFDVLDDTRLAAAGRLIATHCGTEPCFVVGSSGVEYALTAHWRATGQVPTAPQLDSPDAVDQMIVVSGSCSPETQRQIEWALDHGFVGIALDTVRLIDPDQAEAERAAVIGQAFDALASGASVVLHTSLGPQDPRIAATTDYLHTSGSERSLFGERLGAQMGRILRTLLAQTGLRRAIVAGGDSSGHVARQLGIYALELAAPIAPGSPLCSAHSHQPDLDGLQIALKGGQNGKPDYFGRVLHGAAY